MTKTKEPRQDMSEQAWKRIKVSDGHLDYYRKHAISPVNQDLKDLPVHLEKRRALYRSAGLLPSFFAGLDVLEVAPGSGHNSLYIASCKPKNYHLCEPNPTALSGINTLYDAFPMAHTRPLIHPVMLQDFTPERSYDVAICEGWLGSADHELACLQKLAGFIKPGGVLVVTTISPIGIVSNVLRKIMAQRLIKSCDDFGGQTDILLEAFCPHLATMKNMTRPHKDWVQDNLLNPAYFGICLTPELVFQTIGEDFSFYGSAPRITTDWRWHKARFADHKADNDHFLESYYQSAHNFIDHTRLLPLRSAEENRQLENLCWSLLVEASLWEHNGCGDYAGLVPIIENIRDHSGQFCPDIATAIDEFISLFTQPAISTAEVAAMSAFSHLFGRENLYLSLCREGVQS